MNRYPCPRHARESLVRSRGMTVAPLIALLLAIGPSPGANEIRPDLSADVVVVGATPGGIAAAVAAARGGASVILLEEKSHIGGVVSGGLTNADIRKKAA